MARDYPNMSYCMFANTYAAMMQILDAMREAEANGELEQFHHDLSKEERFNFNQLRYACEEYLDAVHALEASMEDE